MDFELTWIDPSLVVCRPFGLAEVKGYEDFLRALSTSPEYRPDVKVLMDIRTLDVSALTAADIEELAELRMRFARERTARSAMVVGSASRLRFGLGRMFEGYLVSQSDFETRVFEELDEALLWLQTGDTDPVS